MLNFVGLWGLGLCELVDGVFFDVPSEAPCGMNVAHEVGMLHIERWVSLLLVVGGHVRIG